MQGESGGCRGAGSGEKEAAAGASSVQNLQRALDPLNSHLRRNELLLRTGRPDGDSAYSHARTQQSGGAPAFGDYAAHITRTTIFRYLRDTQPSNVGRASGQVVPNLPVLRARSARISLRETCGKLRGEHSSTRYGCRRLALTRLANRANLAQACKQLQVLLVGAEDWNSRSRSV